MKKIECSGKTLREMRRTPDYKQNNAQKAFDSEYKGADFVVLEYSDGRRQVLAEQNMMGGFCDCCGDTEYEKAPLIAVYFCDIADITPLLDPARAPSTTSAS